MYIISPLPCCCRGGWLFPVKFCILNQDGRMQEWLNWHAWKVCRLFTGSPGFESPSFRQVQIGLSSIIIVKLTKPIANPTFSAYYSKHTLDV